MHPERGSRGRTSLCKGPTKPQGGGEGEGYRHLGLFNTPRRCMSHYFRGKYHWFSQSQCVPTSPLHRARGPTAPWAPRSSPPGGASWGPTPAGPARGRPRGKEERHTWSPRSRAAIPIPSPPLPFVRRTLPADPGGRPGPVFRSPRRRKQSAARTAVPSHSPGGGGGGTPPSARKTPPPSPTRGGGWLGIFTEHANMGGGTLSFPAVS